MTSEMKLANAQPGEILQRQRASNRRVAWTLASVAAVFFAGIIATRWVGAGTIGIGVMGAVVLLFLVVAIGRNLRATDERAGTSAGPDDTAARETAGVDARERGASGAASEGRR